MSAMSRKIATSFAAIAMALSFSTLATPTASAAEATPAVGSLAICLGVPLGSLFVGFCI
ncbi:hypothetical protein [Rhodococcus sp. WMMA185]|uniref:hypothetical protein n=1 Tax=Rhodococcus sp. WMMA185 TaxID=679318 RepID=UPI0012F4CDB6|nr:hypothetical protein [Rhodococcus sp. WMMA185]